jgi:ribosomal protein S18 acetylase RimI-like enzyme
MISLLEQLSANAWPAAVNQLLDGWVLRYASGVSRRANSVLALAGGEAEFEARVQVVEEFYARRGLPARFHLSPAVVPADLDQRLEARGYRLDCPTFVQTTAIEGLLGRIDAVPEEGVELTEHPDAAWFEVYYASHPWSAEDQEVRRGILARIGPRSAFVTLKRDGRPVAVGQGVVERGWLGLFSMVTHAGCRRQGAATAVLQALARWGRAHGAAGCYLQVMEESVGALALYRKLGFSTQYQYHYRSREHG